MGDCRFSLLEEVGKTQSPEVRKTAAELNDIEATSQPINLLLLLKSVGVV